MIPTRPHGRARHPVVGRIACVLLLAATGCGSKNGDLDAFGGRTMRRDTTPATTGLPPEPPTTFLAYGARSCPFAPESAHGLVVECHELTVPMRRDKPSTRQVKIAVAYIHSSSPTPQPDPVLYLEGGPGGSAISSIDFWTSPPATFLENRDLILVDQRGTGFSEPRLTCSQLTDDVATSFVTRYAEECVTVLHNSGVDLSAFDTTESAADLHDLRKAMKIPAWNLFGISYGTRLALWTMHKFPQGIRSVVIDSVYPPTVKAWESIGANFLRAVRAVAADCAAQPACAAAYPDVEGQLVAAIDKLNARRAGGGDAFAEDLFHALYDTRVGPHVPRAISLANRGQTNAAYDALSPERTTSLPPGARSRPHMSEALYQSVECAETGPLSTLASIRASGKDIPAQVAKPFIDGDVALVALCSVWKVDPNPLVAVSSAIPTLSMAGTYDPITPPAWAELAASTLSRSQYQVVNGSGHGTWTAGECPKQKIKLFFDDPLTVGPDCTGSAPEFIL